MSRALVLNATYEPLCVVADRRALVLVLAQKAAASSRPTECARQRAPQRAAAVGGPADPLRAGTATRGRTAHPAGGLRSRWWAVCLLRPRRPPASTTSSRGAAGVCTCGRTSSRRVGAATTSKPTAASPTSGGGCATPLPAAGASVANPGRRPSRPAVGPVLARPCRRRQQPGSRAGCPGAPRPARLGVDQGRGWAPRGWVRLP